MTEHSFNCYYKLYYLLIQIRLCSHYKSPLIDENTEWLRNLPIFQKLGLLASAKELRLVVEYRFSTLLNIVEKRESLNIR